MSNIVTPDLLEFGRVDLNSALTDTLTNSRTGAQLPCYLHLGTGLMLLSYVPRPIRLSPWSITFPYGSDVRAGDVLTGVVGQPPSTLTNGLVAYWKFDENAGTAASDATGNGNTGALTGATWVPGKINSGIGLDGADDYVDIGNPADTNFDRAQPFTLAAWAAANSLTTNMRLFGKFMASPQYTGYSVALNGPQIEFQLIHDDSAPNYLDMITTSPGGLPDTAFHHIAATYDGTSTPAGVHIYVDGSNLALTTVSNTLSASIISTSSLRIGNGGAGLAQPWAGKIDEAGIWNRALTAAEITSLYNAGVGRQLPFQGAYCVNEVLNPRTYSVATVTECIQTRHADNSLNMLTNETVTFQRRTSASATPVTLANKRVLIYAPERDALAGPGGMALDYKWAMCFDPQYVFDGTPTGEIGDNDQFRWVSPRASQSEITAGGKLWTLRTVVQHFNPYPLATAFFEEAQ